MALLQICDTTTQRFEPSSQFASVKPRGILQLGLWWALLAFLVVGGYGIARTLDTQCFPHPAQSRFLWLDMASVAPEFRGDLEFLRWLAQPGRFGSDMP
jgi:hypothetical protein